MCFGFKSGRDKDARIPILSELLFIPKVATFVLVGAAMSVRPGVVVGSRKFCPGFCASTKRVTVRSMSEGEQGWALPPVYLGMRQTPDFFHLGLGTIDRG